MRAIFKPQSNQQPPKLFSKNLYTINSQYNMKQDPKYMKATQFLSHVEGDINANDLDYLYDDGNLTRRI